MTSRTANLRYAASHAKPKAEPLHNEDFAAAMPATDKSLSIARGDMIIAAAYALLSEYGLEGLTVRAVLNKTGLNRRAFYDRFSGKDDLVLAVFEQTLRLLAVQCREQVQAMRDPLERLRFIVTFIVFGSSADGAQPARDIRRNAALCREHMRLAESRPNDLRVALRPLITLLSEQLAAGIENGQVRNSPPERLATLLYNLVSTTVHAETLAREAGEPERISQPQLADDIWEFCRRGIAA
jgi:AcrR family transcriptional regulator